MKKTQAAKSVTQPVPSLDSYPITIKTKPKTTSDEITSKIIILLLLRFKLKVTVGGIEPPTFAL